MQSKSSDSLRKPSAFIGGVKAAVSSVFVVVLFGTYISIGALAHDLNFSLTWLVLSTLLMWAGPAQVILMSSLGAGGALAEIAIAISLSGVRLLPMVVSLLPLLKDAKTPLRKLILPAHLTAISMWIESLRLLPKLPREARISFANGLGASYMAVAIGASVMGYYLAASLPSLIVATLLFLTPVSFLVSVARNSQAVADRVALALGVIIAPVLAIENIGLDLLWTGLIGGTIAYVVHRVYGAYR